MSLWSIAGTKNTQNEPMLSRTGSVALAVASVVFTTHPVMAFTTGGRMMFNRTPLQRPAIGPRRRRFSRPDLKMISPDLSTALVDQTSTAISIFSDIRTPASLIAGITYAEIFALGSAFKADGPSYNRSLVRLYEMFAIVSLATALATVVISTGAISKTLTGFQDPFATSAMELLGREMEREYLGCSWSFAVSLITFLEAATIRIFAELNAREESRQVESWAAVGLMQGVSLYSLSIVNLALAEEKGINNLGGLTVAYWSQEVSRLVTEFNPIEIASFASFCVGICCFAVSFYRSDDQR